MANKTQTKPKQQQKIPNPLKTETLSPKKQKPLKPPKKQNQTTNPKD